MQNMQQHLKPKLTDEEKVAAKKAYRKAYYSRPEVKKRTNAARKLQRHEFKEKNPEDYRAKRDVEAAKERERSQTEKYKDRKRKWRAANPDRCRGYWKKYMSKPENQAKKSAYWKSDHYRQLKRFWSQMHPRDKITTLLGQIRRKHRRLGLFSQPSMQPLNASDARVLVKKILEIPCVYCGEAAEGIDRIDPRNPYVIPNVVPSCTVCNMMKASFTPQELADKCESIIQWNAAQNEDETNEFADELEGRCFYCGNGPDEEHIGIDRLDSKIGYEEGNCVPCCSPCNFMKRNMHPDTFKARAGIIVAHLMKTKKPGESLDTQMQNLSKTLGSEGDLIALSDPLTVTDTAETFVCVMQNAQTYHNAGCSRLQGAYETMLFEEAMKRGKMPCNVCRFEVFQVETEYTEPARSKQIRRVRRGKQCETKDVDE